VIFHRLQLQRYFYNGRNAGLWHVINPLSVMAACELEVRSRSFSGHDRHPMRLLCRKLIKGHKLHIVTDTLGLMVAAVVHLADVQDHNVATISAQTGRSCATSSRPVGNSSIRLAGHWTAAAQNRSCTPP